MEEGQGWSLLTNEDLAPRTTPPTPRSVRVRCPAKLNLFLEVVRRRADGYHDLDTVMQAVDLCDELRVTPHDGSALTLECSDPSLPTDEGNVALRAALALRQRAGFRGGAHLALTKRIPQQAGLGGGSSDAAGALVGLNRAWGLELSTEELRQVAAELGSDVAFFLYGGTARCTGRGEVVEPLAAPATFRYVLVCPRVGVSTAEAYGRLCALTSRRASASIMISMLREGSVEGTGGGLFNRLEEAAFDLRPELRGLKERLARSAHFAGVAMTGSGSALFGLCRPADWAPAREACAALGAGDVYAIQSLPHGAIVASAARGCCE